jgi:hypothetical protein
MKEEPITAKNITQKYLNSMERIEVTLLKGFIYITFMTFLIIAVYFASKGLGLI